MEKLGRVDKHAADVLHAAAELGTAHIFTNLERHNLGDLFAKMPLTRSIIEKYGIPKWCAKEDYISQFRHRDPLKARNSTSRDWKRSSYRESVLSVLHDFDNDDSTDSDFDDLSAYPEYFRVLCVVVDNGDIKAARDLSGEMNKSCMRIMKLAFKKNMRAQLHNVARQMEDFVKKEGFQEEYVTVGSDLDSDSDSEPF